MITYGGWIATCWRYLRQHTSHCAPGLQLSGTEAPGAVSVSRPALDPLSWSCMHASDMSYPLFDLPQTLYLLEDWIMVAIMVRCLVPLLISWPPLLVTTATMITIRAVSPLSDASMISSVSCARFGICTSHAKHSLICVTSTLWFKTAVRWKRWIWPYHADDDELCRSARHTKHVGEDRGLKLGRS